MCDRLDDLNWNYSQLFEYDKQTKPIFRGQVSRSYINSISHSRYRHSMNDGDEPRLFSKISIVITMTVIRNVKYLWMRNIRLIFYIFANVLRMRLLYSCNLIFDRCDAHRHVIMIPHVRPNTRTHCAAIPLSICMCIGSNAGNDNVIQMK